jgi:hypothetical protein
VELAAAHSCCALSKLPSKHRANILIASCCAHNCQSANMAVTVLKNLVALRPNAFAQVNRKASIEPQISVRATRDITRARFQQLPALPKVAKANARLTLQRITRLERTNREWTH